MNESVYLKAAKDGDLEALKSYRKKVKAWDRRIIIVAAEHGHLGIVQHIYFDSLLFPEWDTDTTAYAAYGGHVDILQWVIERGCPSDERVREYATEAERHEVLSWLNEREL